MAIRIVCESCGRPTGRYGSGNGDREGSWKDCPVCVRNLKLWKIFCFAVSLGIISWLMLHS